MLDVKALAGEIARAVREQIKAAVSALDTRMTEVTGQVATFEGKFAAFRQPADGKDADPAVIRAEVERAVAALPKPKDGDSVHPDTVALMVRDEVAKAVAALPAPPSIDPVALSADIAAAAAKAVEALPKPRDGVDYDPAALDTAVKLAVAGLPKPEPGKDADPEMVRRLVAEAVAALPRPKDGDPGKDASPEAVRAEVERAVAALPKPSDGKSVDMAELAGMISEAAAKAVAALPKPQDGKPGPTVEQLAPIIQSEVQRAAAALPKAAPDAEAIRIEAQRVVDSLPRPKDGTPGVTAEELAPAIRAEVERAVSALPKPRDGKDADPEAIELAIRRAVDAIRVPKDGDSVTVEDVRPLLEAELARWALDFERRAGDTLQRAVDHLPKPKDGLDGFSLDDLEIELKDGRTLVMTLRAGQRVATREVVLTGMPIDRGVYRSGQAAKAGDGCTYAGSYWIATRDTDESPSGPSHHWRLAVKGAK